MRRRARSAVTGATYERQHLAILAAIAAGDAHGAEVAMREHLNTLAERLRIAGTAAGAGESADVA